MMKSSRTMGVFFPDELIYEILIRIPAIVLLRFKTVCKHWRTLISCREFALAHLTQSKPDHILFSWRYKTGYEKHGITSYSINIQDNIMTSHKLQLPLDHDHDQFCVRSSNYGLVLLQHHTLNDPNNIAIYNPITRRYKRLPPPPNKCYRWAIVHDAISGRYKVFGIKSTQRAYVLMLGLSSDWKYLHTLGTTFGKTEFKSSGLSGLLQTIHRLSEVRGCLCLTNAHNTYLETWILDDRANNSWNKCSVLNLISPFLGSFLIPSDINDLGKILDSTKLFICDHDHDHLSVFDAKNQKLTEMAMQRKVGWLDQGFCFHINSLVNWE